MVSFRHPDAVGIVSRTKVFSLAESLGGVESLIEVPQAMTHQSVEGSRRRGARPISCGCRAGSRRAEDLVEDLAQAIGLKSCAVRADVMLGGYSLRPRHVDAGILVGCAGSP